MIETVGSLTGELNAGNVELGTTNYEKLENKPLINGVELVGNKTLEELGIATKEDVENAIKNNITTALEGEY